MAKFLVALCLLLGSAGIFVSSNVIIPEAEDKLGLGIGLGGVGIGVTLNIPDINLGLSLNSVMNLTAILQIIAKPVDPNTVSSCSTADTRGGLRGDVHPRNVKSGGLWYSNGDGTYFMAVVIDPSLTSDELNTVYAGMYMISSKTCLKFYLYNEASLAGFDYVYLQKSTSGCYSSDLGRAGKGKQIVNLQPTDSQGRTCMIPAIAAHELLHAIGHAHMQNTPGRDNYVQIVWANIPGDTNTRYQFQEVSSTQFSSLGAAYDYNSVMHYGRYDFTANGGETIHALQGDPDAIGQRQDVSAIDAWKVKTQYSCK